MRRNIRSAAASAPIAATRSRCAPSTAQATGEVQTVTAHTETDEGRAYHSAYFEMLGEQGFPGLVLFLLIHIIGLVRMEMLRRRYRKAEGDKAWIAPLATALQHFQIIYLVGALVRRHRLHAVHLVILAVQIGLDSLVARRERAEQPTSRLRSGREPAGRDRAGMSGAPPSRAPTFRR